MLTYLVSWSVTIDLEYHLPFPAETTLTTHCPDLVIWSVHSKRVHIIELMVPLRKILTGHISVNWRSMKIGKNKCRKWLDDQYFSC